MRSEYGDDFISGRSIAKNAWLSVDAFVVFSETAAVDSLAYVHPGRPGYGSGLKRGCGDYQ